MKRPLLIILGAGLAAFGLFAAAYLVGQRACALQMARTGDDLEWLRREFRLGGAEMAHIRQLHNGYLPKCEAMCKEIAAKKNALETALAGATNVTADAAQKLSELAALRARCQTQMLQHFVEVSRAMPTEQGRRYLKEMQRLTLGFHEQFEQSMSDHPAHAHGLH